MASPPKSPSKRMVPPPPPIGGGRRTAKKPPAAKPTAEASDPEAAKAKATPDDAEGDAAPAKAETSALDMDVSASDPNLFEDGATARWPNVNAPIASDESTGGSPVPDIEPTESSAGAPRPPVLAKLGGNGDSSLPPPPAFSTKERKRDALVMGVDGLDETPSEKITAPRRPAKTETEAR